MGALNFNFAPKFHQNGEFSAQIMYVWKKYSDKKICRFSDSVQFGGSNWLAPYPVPQRNLCLVKSEALWDIPQTFHHRSTTEFRAYVQQLIYST